MKKWRLALGCDLFDHIYYDDRSVKPATSQVHLSGEIHQLFPFFPTRRRVSRHVDFRGERIELSNSLFSSGSQGAGSIPARSHAGQLTLWTKTGRPRRNCSRRMLVSYILMIHEVEKRTCDSRVPGGKDHQTMPCNIDGVLRLALFPRLFLIPPGSTLTLPRQLSAR